MVQYILHFNECTSNLVITVLVMRPSFNKIEEISILSSEEQIKQPKLFS
jgi:hypothetical protein